MGEEEDEPAFSPAVPSSDRGSSTTLTAVTASAMRDPRVREMLEAFRAGGPEALAPFVSDPACFEALEVLRGAAGTAKLPPTPHVPWDGDQASTAALPRATATLLPHAASDAVSSPLRCVVEAAAPVVAQGVQSARVRAMLEAFRAEGPSALARFAEDSDCNELVSRLRGLRSTEAVPQRLVPSDRRPRVLLGATGSVATVKVAQLALALAEFADVKVVLTHTAARFFDQASRDYDAASRVAFDSAVTAGAIEVLRSADEWSAWQKIGDEVVHIELRKWADAMLIAPLSAHSLGKLANGLCDDLLSCVARAWDFDASKPIIVAPAMNTAMWRHPLTAPQLATLGSFGYGVVMPVSKTLACGDIGVGGLAELPVIVKALKDALGLP